MMKPATVGDAKDIDWEGSWKTYGEIFDGKAAEVGRAPAPPYHATAGCPTLPIEQTKT